jgi:hypothetical protein
MLSQLKQDILLHPRPVRYGLFGLYKVGNTFLFRVPSDVRGIKGDFVSLSDIRECSRLCVDQLVVTLNVAHPFDPQLWWSIRDVSWLYARQIPIVLLISQDATYVLRAEIEMRHNLIRLGYPENNILAMRVGDEELRIETMLCLLRMGQLNQM